MSNIPVSKCKCCGSTRLIFDQVLWAELIRAWNLSSEEAAYIDRQQGLHCGDCGSSLRSMALAKAIMSCFEYEGTFARFVRTFRAKRLRILEVNEAGGLTQFFTKLRRHRLVSYPEHDMTSLCMKDRTFDLVVHSDTLEHVPNPVKGLSECRRVLKAGGFCCYTVPIVIGRVTRSREGLTPSYHGSDKNCRGDYLVHTEYGCDFWQDVVRAGFRECRIVWAEHPAAHAVIGVA